ncbi:MAG TPA: glycosyltransferase [Xanthomonadaceae bacterium]|nr:glycosyltransferase [Xanthomonadaceae bacterium]
MPTSAAELRFLAERAFGLWRRGVSSLRTRGLRASWRRLALHLSPLSRDRGDVDLYAPSSGAGAPAAVPASPSPRASIVIPVHGQLARTLDCLHALAAHPPAAACEVIVVDDASPDGTAAALAGVAGLRLLRRETNAGFIAACNEGAALARGDCLVFLNNDTVPQPGWLDALLDTFEQHPGTGLVGAQLLYPDGRLQEAGGMVFEDGSAWNYGRFEAPGDPRFAFVRDADYCSGAAIAIPRTVFAKVGGFDARYAPAYYEDADLAFKMRAEGLRVLYQPAARVVHAEGATAGTDPDRGAKAYQARNRAVFAQHWADALRAYPARHEPDASSVAGGRPQVLVVDTLTPAPDRDSGSLRLVNLMRLLVEQGAHVVFVPADLRHAGRDTVALQQSGIECWHAPWTGSLPRWLRGHGARFDVVLACRHYLARELLPVVRRHAPRARLVFDTVDLHYLREQRGADLAGDPAMLRAARRTRELELDVVARADTTLVVSHVEQAVLAEDAPGARVEVLSNVLRVAGPGRPFAQRRDLVFVGGFRHPPNVDAVRWFLAEVFPLVRARLPDVVFHCIGDEPPGELRALAGIPGVQLHGHVPDIAPWMDACRVAVAPLRFGAGVKGKVNFSMAHGQPVVATPCAVEGMFLRDGEDVLVAGDAAGFADAVVRLHEDEALWSMLARNGMANVARHFSFDAARDAVRRIFL